MSTFLALFPSVNFILGWQEELFDLTVLLVAAGLAAVSYSPVLNPIPLHPGFGGAIRILHIGAVLHS